MAFYVWKIKPSFYAVQTQEGKVNEPIWQVDLRFLEIEKYFHKKLGKFRKIGRRRKRINLQTQIKTANIFM